MRARVVLLAGLSLIAAAILAPAALEAADWVASEIGPTGTVIRNLAAGPGRNDAVNRLYATNQNGHLYEYTWTGSTWSVLDAGIVYSGSYVSDFVAVGPGRNDGVNRVYVTSFWNVAEFTWTGSAFSSATVGSGADYMAGVVVGTGRNDAIQRVYAGGLDGNIYDFTWSGSSWTRVSISAPGRVASWVSLSSSVRDASWRVYAATQTGPINEFTWNGSTWTGGLVGNLGGEPNIVYGATGRNDGTGRLYVTGLTNKLWEYSWTGSTWSGSLVGDIGGSGRGLVFDRAKHDGTYRLYATAASSRIAEATWTGSAWSTATITAGGSGYWSLASGPLRGDGVVRLYAGNDVGKLYEITYDTVAPLAPGGLAVSNTAGGAAVGNRLSLYWIANTEGDLKDYRIRRSTATGITAATASVATVNSPGTTHQDGGLGNGTTYYYRLTARDTALNESAISASDVGTYPADTVAPVAPAGLGASDVPADQGGALRLNWTANTESDLKDYRVWRGLASGGIGTKSPVAILVAPGTTHQDGGLVNGTTYYFQLTARDTSLNESGGSVEANSFPYDNLAPAAPTGLSVLAGTGLVNLSWTANTEGDLKDYRIRRSTMSGITGATPVVAAIVAPGTTHQDGGLAGNTTYFFRLSARDASLNESGLSVEVSTQPGAAGDTTPPATPTGLTVTQPAQDRTLVIGWSANTEPDFSQYRLYKATFSGTVGSKASIITVTVTSYTDGGLQDGTTYYFQLTAVDGSANASGATAEVSGVTRGGVDTTPPAAISDLTALVGTNDGQVGLAWTAPGDDGMTGTATTYELRRATYQITTPAAYDAAVIVTTASWVGNAAPAVAGTASSTTIVGLNPGVTYYFSMKARDEVPNWSSLAAPANNWAPAQNGPPNVPALPNGSSPGGGIINLYWTANTEADLKDYRIWRATSTGALGTKGLVRTIAASGTTHQDAGLTQSINYFYQLTARDTVGYESGGSGEMTIFAGDLVAPSSPTALGVANQGLGGRLNLSWAANTESDLKDYRTWRSTFSSPLTGKSSTTAIAAPGTTHQDAGLANGTSYFYQLTARDTSGNESAGSPEAYAYPADTTPPLSPVGAGVGNPGTGGVLRLSWVANTESDIKDYGIHRATWSGAPLSPTPVVILHPGTTHQDAGLQNGTSYYYRITARDVSGNNSGASTEMSAYPSGADTTPPATPSGLGVGNPGVGNALRLSWTANTEGDLKDYGVYRGTYSNTLPFKFFQARVTAPGTTHQDAGLANGATYYYQLTARDTSGNESGGSIEVNGVPGGGDTTPPTSAISSPAAGAALTTLTTISGTASDNAGLDRVEVSIRRLGPGSLFWTGGGWIGPVETWLIASGTGAWAYVAPAWTTGETYLIRSRARDLAGNYQSGPAETVWVYVAAASSIPATGWRWEALPSGSTRPVQRIMAGMASDPSTNYFYVFGGASGPVTVSTVYSDVWRYDVTAGAWMQLSPSGTGPGARYEYGMASDEGSPARMLIFGGYDLVSNFNTTHALTYNTTAWAALATVGTPPSARRSHLAVSVSRGDAQRRMLVFGGFPDTPANDAFLFDVGLSSWTPLAPVGTPPSVRDQVGGVYDDTRDRVLIFGGDASGVKAGDAWALYLNPVRWVPLATISTPTARSGQAMAFDRANDRVLLYGGATASADSSETHALDLKSLQWTLLTTSGTPTGRFRPAAAVNAAGEMVVFGGRNGSAQSNDLFRLVYSTAAPAAPTGNYLQVTSSASATAGVAFISTVTAKNSGGVPISTATDVVTLTTSDLYDTEPAARALVNGTTTFSVTLVTAGSVTLTASAAGYTSGSTVTWVGAGTAAALQVILPGEVGVPGKTSAPAGKTGSPVSQPAGVAFTATVNTVDAWWNVVTVASLTVTVVTSDPNDNDREPLPAQLVNGTRGFAVAPVTLGNVTVTASAAGYASATSASVLITNATPPAAPQGLTATPQEGATIRLAWSVSTSADVTTYRIYYATATSLLNFTAPSATVAHPTSSYVTPVLTAGQTYSFVVRAVNASGNEETNANVVTAQALSTLAGAVRARVAWPLNGNRVAGARMTVIGEVVAGADRLASIRFDYRPETSSTWTVIPPAVAGFTNPDLTAPYFVQWDMRALDLGTYRIRAVAADRDGNLDPAPAEVSVVHVAPRDVDLEDTVTSRGERQVRQVVRRDQDNRVRVGDDRGEVTEVRIPAGALVSTQTVVRVVLNPTDAAPGQAGLNSLGRTRRISFEDGTTTLRSTFTVRVAFRQDASGNIQGTRASPRALLYCRWNPALGRYQWVPITAIYNNARRRWEDARGNEITPGSSRFGAPALASLADAAPDGTSVVEAETNQDGDYALFIGAAENLDTTLVYPNPFKPNSDATHTDITFANLTEESTIEVLTVAGERVWMKEKVVGRESWPGTNEAGEPVTTGVYVYVITSKEGQKSIGKLAVIR